MNDDKVKIVWKDTKFEELGVILEQTDTDIRFESKYDGTVNWIPMKYIVIAVEKQVRRMEKQNGKGSKPRPYSVEYEEFAKNWDTIFHKYKKSTGFRITKKDKNNERYQGISTFSTRFNELQI